MAFTHKTVHANDRDEIWVQNKTSSIINPESNDPVTGKAVVEYVEDKMGNVGNEGVTMGQVNAAMAAQATETADEIRTAIEAIPAPVSEKVKTWIGLKCFRAEPIGQEIGVPPMEDVDFDVSGYCIMAYHNIVCVYAQLKCKRRLYEAYGDYNQEFVIGAMNDAIPQPMFHSFITFPITVREDAGTNGAGRTDSTGSIEAQENMVFYHWLHWKTTDFSGIWDEGGHASGSISYIGTNTCFDMPWYIQGPTSFIPPSDAKIMQAVEGEEDPPE
jgi:hypothetical protein